MEYHVVKAKNFQQAIENAPFKCGQLRRIVSVHASANGDGTYTVWPEYSQVGETPLTERQNPCKVE